MSNKSRVLILSLVLLVVSFFVPITNPSHSGESLFFQDVSDESITNYLENEKIDDPISQSHTAADEFQGVLDPIELEQRGNWTTPVIHAETDSNSITKTNLSIDTLNNWEGSRASVELWNLERLYLVNGSFSEGIVGSNLNPSGSVPYYPYGWDATSYRPDLNQDMYAGYSNQEINLLSNGYGSPGNYFFANDSSVYWVQTINNTPASESFLFNVDFSYIRGPSSTALKLQALVDDTVIWNTTMESITLDTWQNSGEITVDLTGIGDVFEFKFGLYFDDDVIYNWQWIEFLLDNVEFMSEDNPSFNELDIAMNIGGATNTVTGLISGHASITNSSRWRTEQVQVKFSSSLSVSFDYSARMLSHRYLNSTSTDNPFEEGVHFNVQSNTTVALQIYMYLGVLPDIDDFTMIVPHPKDWENSTIYNPYQTEVTSSCTITPDNITIPESILSTLGWWRVDMESPNYANSVNVQKLDIDWVINQDFRTGDSIRSTTEISHENSAPTSLENVHVIWRMPNDTIWFEENLDSLSNSVNGTSLYLSGMNTTAGLWSVEITWSNSTEVAYGVETFALYHKAALVPEDPIVNVETGVFFTTFVTFRDVDNNDILTESGISVTANWSASVVSYYPNEFRNQFQAEFNASLIPAGIHLVVVNATSEYYDDSSCTFLVINTIVDNNLEISQSATEMNLSDTIMVEFTYTDSSGNGIDDANVTFAHDGTSGGLVFDTVSDNGDGNYSVEITSVFSGTYGLTFTASKDYYEADEDIMLLHVSELGSALLITNGTASVVQYGESYRVVLRYENSTGSGLDLADVDILSTLPETGVSISPIVPEGDGYYSIILTPDLTGTYTIVISASKINHKLQLETFTLTATEISSSLVLTASNSISIDQQCTVTFNFSSVLFGGIDNATIVPVNPSDYLDFSETVYSEPGSYQITIIPSQLGSYQIVFKAIAQNFQDATAALSLEVTVISTSYTVIGGLPVTEIEYKEVYSFDFVYEALSSGYNISDADIHIHFAGEETLSYRWSAIGEIYHMEIVGNQRGIYRISIHAMKDDHQDASIEFTLQVIEVSTRVNQINFVSEMTYGRSTSLGFFYEFANNQTGIAGGSLSLLGIPTEWIEIIDLGDGNYSIVITPDELANISATFTFNKDSFASAYTIVSFSVNEIQISLQPQSAIRVNHNELLVLSLDVFESDTDNPVSGALVTYSVYRDQTRIETDVMSEVESNPGTYTGEIDIDWEATNVYRLEVTVEKQYHKLTVQFDEAISIFYPEPPTPLEIIIGFMIDPITLTSIALLATGIIGYRNYRKRQFAKFLEAVAAKKRFDDADNIIGIIIMHSSSGVPIYSSTLKGGFEEGMVSAFISAITHFRSEFDDTTTNWEGEVIPISDIIRIVPTKHLICAFITVSPASKEHEKKMIQFAGAVGEFLDAQMAQVRSHVLDERDAGILDSLFHTEMDGFLLHYYKIGTSASFPKKYRVVEQTLIEEGLKECSRPLHIARLMMNYGSTEVGGCKLLLDCIDQELIVPCSHDEITVFESTDWSVFDSEDFPNGEALG